VKNSRAVVPAPDSAGRFDVHATQPAIDAAQRDPIRVASEHAPAVVSESEFVVE
jgi:hypothetical protein